MATEPVAFDALAAEPADPAIEPASDGALVGLLIDGSHDALAELYDRYGRATFAAALVVTHDRGAAADVVQETFLTLWNRAERFDPSRGALAAWLTTIARNRALDHLRSAGRRHRAVSFSTYSRPDMDDQAMVEWLTETGELVGAGGPEPVPESALVDKETRDSISIALAALVPVERTVITLAYDAGLTQPEIAARLGWPLGTVKTRTRAALRHLRERLEAPPGGLPASAAEPSRMAGEVRPAASCCQGA